MTTEPKERQSMERAAEFDPDFWRSVNCGYCDKGCDIPLREAVAHVTKLESRLSAAVETLRRIADEPDHAICPFMARAFLDSLDKET